MSKIGQLTGKRFFEEFDLPENVDLKSFIFKNVFKLTYITKIYLIVIIYFGSINKRTNFAIFSLIEKMPLSI